MQLPALVIHADWGVAPAKRWEAVAELREGAYVAAAPRLALNPVTDAVRTRGTAVIGFDFPIGVPRGYAARAGIDSFPRLLPELGRGEWRDFFLPADVPAEVGLRRPFYPRVSRTGVAHRHLLDGLGASSMDELRRRCDLGHGSRGPAEVIFWTLGPKQVGKAAIAGWKEILVPDRGEIRLWPFDGDLDDLLADGGVIVCETYPAEFYGHFGLGTAKAAPAARVRAAPHLLAACATLGVEIDAGLRDQIASGFASDDAYDAFVGLLGMINVLRGNRPPAPTLDHAARRVEGWILGSGGPPRAAGR